MATTDGLSDAAIQELAAQLEGPVLRAGDPDYDARRQVWNGMVDRHPAAIARPISVADVVAAVRWARANDVLVSVRGGGHNVTGYAVCDGGLMIDLSLLNGITVDAEARTVRAQGGVRWGELDKATQAFGLATTGGQVSTTGIGGLTLGGGVGWLMRKLGLVVDNLLSVELVTADGEVLTASSSENPELFWGLRGGGGNFGIATQFEYRLHPVGPLVFGGMALFPAERAEEILRFFREFAGDAPDELMAVMVFMSAPPAPFIPEAVHGAPLVAIAVCYAGSVPDGEQAVAPLRALGPVVDMLQPMPYTAVQQLFDDGVPFGRHVYLKSEHLAALDEDVMQTVLRYTPGRTSPLSVVLLFPLGGAVAQVGADETAFVHRDATFDYVVYSMWEDPAEAGRHIAWTREFGTAMAPFSRGVYVNELGAEGADRVRAAYSSETFERLQALKDRYDPTNFFHLNQNIPPSA
jgi:FAD/FMN-containing dehydrogenase